MQFRPGGSKAIKRRFVVQTPLIPLRSLPVSHAAPEVVGGACVLACLLFTRFAVTKNLINDVRDRGGGVD